MSSAATNLGDKQWQEYLKNGAAQISVTLSTDQLNQCACYAQELVNWNRKINLTSIRDPLEIAVKHFIDSWVPAKEIKTGASVIDIGAGGGFPGIPLKILNPSLSMTLIDGSRKKISFLKQVIRSLDLKGIQARHIRAEEFPSSEGPGYDVAICRALGSLELFVRLALPLTKSDGKMIAMKGIKKMSEIEALRVSSFLLPDGDRITGFHLGTGTREYVLPISGDQRTLYIIRRRGTIHS